MKALDRAIDNVETLLEFFARFLSGRDFASYCDLETAVALSDADIAENPEVLDPHTLVTRHNAMVSVFDLQGIFRLLSEAEYIVMLDNLRMKLGSVMRSPGHSLSFVLERDPDRAHDELMRLAEPQLRTASRIGLAIEDVVLSRVERNTPFVAWEQNLLVVYTHLPAMSSEEIKRVIADRAKESRLANVPRMDYGQHPASVLAALKYRHDSFVERVKDDFLKSGPAGESGVLLTPLSAHEAARAIRIQIDREHTSQVWRPRLPGDKVLPTGRPAADDFSDVTHPKLSYQICTHDPELAGEFVKTDGLYHSTMTMELGPLEPRPFRDLLSNISRAMPWRIRFDLEPGGLDKARGRRALLSFVGMFPGNKTARDTFQHLEAIDRDDPVCTMRVAVSTWAPDLKKVKERSAALEKALQSWGVCSMRSASGADPLEVFASGVAGFSTNSMANMMFPPLGSALQLLPFQRPATPWATTGSLVQRTPDGKIFPIGIASPLQDVDIVVVSATPGSGKSLWLNCRHLASCVRAGLSRLPRILIMDVDYSSLGFITMLRDSLPDHRKHEALAIRITNDSNFAVNLFDIQLGANAPMPVELDFMQDMVSILLIDAMDLLPPSGDAGRLANALVREMFDRKLRRQPEKYEKGVESEVDECLDRHGLRSTQAASWWEDATWVEVRDLLFANKHVTAANSAHLRAMPTLPDLGAALLEPGIKELFKTARTRSGELLLTYAERSLTTAASQYPVLAGRTRYQLGSETRVLSVDLKNVIGSTTNEGLLKTSIMYLFARHLGARNFFLSEEELLPVLPKSNLYHDYHLARIADVKDEQKFMYYDEGHNIGYKGSDERTHGLTFVADRIEKDGRENRKNGVSIGFVSQYLDDVPDKLLNAASSVLVMRGGNEADADTLRKRWRVSDECIRQLHQVCTGPGPSGVNYLALFKTKIGTITQILTNTAGAQELWAFSTTPGDRALRDRVVKVVGPEGARRLLAKRFKSGSAEKHINHLKNTAGADDGESVLDRLAAELINEHHAAVAAGDSA